jgi:restriction system protein
VRPMSVTWGIHNEHPALDLLGNGMVTIGWDEAGDLRPLGANRSAIKQRVANTYPEAKPGAIPIWAGVLLRFAFEMQPGDIVIWPNRQDSTLNFGRVAGDYRYETDASHQRNRRSVAWLKTGIPRAQFSQGALYEVGSSVTLFKVKSHEAEFLTFLRDGVSSGKPESIGAPSDVSDEVATSSAEAEPSAERIETHSRDFVVNALMTKIDGFEFEHFVAHLLRRMGYRTQITQATGDGGFDIVAHRDPLGLEPPIIKVQCKRTIAAIGQPDLQKLTGTLAPGGSELGLFVTLGGYTPEAKNFGRNRQDLRLITGTELVDLVFEHYDDFDPEWKRLLPLRRVYVVDLEPQSG